MDLAARRMEREGDGAKGRESEERYLHPE